jgi:hypothetical protein
MELGYGALFWIRVKESSGATVSMVPRPPSQVMLKSESYVCLAPSRCLLFVFIQLIVLPAHVFQRFAYGGNFPEFHRHASYVIGGGDGGVAGEGWSAKP